MELCEYKLVQAALSTSDHPIDTVKDLVYNLVHRGIFSQADVEKHMVDIIDIWNEWKQEATPSPPDSKVNGMQDDEADLNSLTGWLAMYGPVDNRVSIRVTKHTTKA